MEFLLLLHPWALKFNSIQTIKPQAFCDRGPVRILIEYSYRQEISLPVIRDPGFRAHDVSLCELEYRVTEPKFCFLYESHALLLRSGHCNNRLILILCGRIVHGPQCTMFVLCYCNSVVFHGWTCQPLIVQCLHLILHYCRNMFANPIQSCLGSSFTSLCRSLTLQSCRSFY